MKRLGLILLLLAPQAVWAADALPPTDALAYPGGSWSPYLVGAGIGVLSWFTFALSGKAIGASTSYAMLAGMLGKAVAPKHTDSLQYFKKNPPQINWGVAFVGAAIVGSFIAAYSGGEITNEWLPPMWSARFGDSILLRGAFAMLGGILMAFGARLAGGCTSGHGISGSLQLNPGSLLTLIALFVSGIVTACLLYHT